MRDLIFFTSNITKLAHARYVAEGLPVKSGGFGNKHTTLITTSPV